MVSTVLKRPFVSNHFKGDAVPEILKNRLSGSLIKTFDSIELSMIFPSRPTIYSCVGFNHCAFISLLAQRSRLYWLHKVRSFKTYLRTLYYLAFKRITEVNLKLNS